MFLYSVIVQLVSILAAFALTENKHYQYVAKIISTNNNGEVIICSGTVLTSKRVLTVADCLIGQPRNKPNIVVKYNVGDNLQNSSVVKIHFHHHFSQESHILWRVCLLKLKHELQLTGANNLGIWVNITNYIRTAKQEIQITALSFGRRKASETYASMVNILETSLVVMDRPCPCFTRNESALIYCSDKMQLNGRCGDKFSDAGGPVFNNDALEGILYALYSDEQCLPDSMNVIVAPCNSLAFAVIIPICVHKQWISSRVQINHIGFHDSCAKGNNIKKKQILSSIFIFYLQIVLIKYL